MSNERPERGVTRLTRHILWLFETLLIIFPLLILGLLPRRLSARFGEIAGICLFRIFSDKRRIALKNIEIAVKGGLAIKETPEQVTKKHFINLGRSLAEVSMIILGRDKTLRDIVFEGIDEYESALKKGRGVILITGHCGNWELVSLAKSWKGMPFSPVARALNNPYLNCCVESLRTRYGNKVIYKKGALKEILTILNNGGVAGLIIDQSVTESEAVVIEFFGEKVYAMKTPALIAMKTGAAVVPVFVNYLGNGRHRFKFHKEIPLKITGDKEEDVIFNTKAFMKKIEDYIKENPSEWLWIHRRFKLSRGRRY
ncbi:MAG: lysophospholipid acyltransferase family protein [Nitrospirae bacterium]|nr:lysophospholipid acyltransferase family protein [Nitrospirota bacterium]